MSKYAANSVLMVPPTDLAFNQQTAINNEFQQTLALSTDSIKQRALSEFNNMVEVLMDKGIDVIIFKQRGNDVATPDAVFPNNWFATTRQGELTIFPMQAENRQAEVNIEQLSHRLKVAKKSINKLTDLRQRSTNNAALEGTGSMVLDHANNTIYASLSGRCHPTLLRQFAMHHQSNLIEFNSTSSRGNPVYHTNVLMSIGDEFAVVCADVIDPCDRKHVLTPLSLTKQLILISEAQMRQFCGNILQLQNNVGQPFIAMSASAFHAFSPSQRLKLGRFGTLLPLPIETIETIGGGSVRCMLAEIFLPVLA